MSPLGHPRPYPWTLYRPRSVHKRFTCLLTPPPTTESPTLWKRDRVNPRALYQRTHTPRPVPRVCTLVCVCEYVPVCGPFVCVHVCTCGVRVCTRARTRVCEMFVSLWDRVRRSWRLGRDGRRDQDLGLRTDRSEAGRTRPIFDLVSVLCTKINLVRYRYASFLTYVSHWSVNTFPRRKIATFCLLYPTKIKVLGPTPSPRTYGQISPPPSVSQTPDVGRPDDPDFLLGPGSDGGTRDPGPVPHP